MFSLHLYKNTEYSRVFTQTGNSYICFFFGTQTFFLPRAIWFIDCSWDESDYRIGQHSVNPNDPYKNSISGQSCLNSCIMMQGLPPPHTYSRWEVPTHTGTWMSFLVVVVLFSSQLRPVSALYIHRLCVNIYSTCFRSFFVAKLAWVSQYWGLHVVLAL